MKRFIATVLCLILCLCCLTAHAEEKTPFESVCEVYTYYHYAFFTLTGAYEFNVEYPLYEKSGHGYDGLVAYTSPDYFVDVVFVPNDFGEGISAVHLLVDAGYFTGEDTSANLRYLYNHLVGVLFPFSMEHAAIDSEAKFKDDMLSAMAYAAVNVGAGFYESDVVRFGGFATVTAYINGDTYGILIEFDQPVTSEMLSERAMLLSAVLSEE